MIFTCVMSTLHGTMVVTHSVKIIEIVLWITTHPVWPSPWRPVRRETPAALASLYHVRSHVHTSEWEFDHVLHLHPAIPILKDGTKLSQTRIMFTTSIFIYAWIFTCRKRFRCSMRMSGKVHRLSLMLPC